MAKLTDKLIIKGELTLLTGMHIGASNDFAPIGAVDSVVVRNPIDKRPIIPGSSIKGKMRTLLAKADYKESGDYLNSIDKDSDIIKRLFGATKPNIISSRLQFCDLFMSEDTVDKLSNKTDLYLTEIKFENDINRTTAVANPRQLERVPAGSVFEFNLIYNVEDDGQVLEDFKNISKAICLLQLDYIGGSGTRGYGKVKFSNLSVKKQNINGENNINEKELEDILKESEGYVLSL